MVLHSTTAGFRNGYTVHGESSARSVEGDQVAIGHLMMVHGETHRPATPSLALAIMHWPVSLPAALGV